MGILWELVQKAKEDLKQAYQNLDYADKDHIDAAIFQICAAEARYEALVREIKQQKGEEIHRGFSREKLFARIE